MKKLHEHLLNEHKWYSKWHENPHHHAVHSVFLLIFMFVVAGTMLASLKTQSASQMPDLPSQAYKGGPFADLKIYERMPGKRYVEGEEAIRVLGRNIDRVAKFYGRTGKELAGALRNDRALKIDYNGLMLTSHYDKPESASLGDGTLPTNPSINQIPDALAFQLHSRPNSTAKIYLDFDGHTTNNTSWNYNGPIVSAPYSRDTDPGFSSQELNDIKSTWRSVAEDYFAFDVDVTTEEPIINYNPYRYIRVVISPSWEWYGQVGGVAYIGSFNWGDNTPAFVFSNLLYNNIKYISEATTHETGHTLKLFHTSNYDANCVKISDYYSGSGSNPGWAPIMGVGYYKGVTQFTNTNEWSQLGDSYGCNSEQDDIGVITNPNLSYLQFAIDEAGSTANIAGNLTKVVMNGVANIDHLGALSRYDTDLYKITAQAGDINITVNPMTPILYNLIGNADFRARLLDSNMSVLSESNPSAVVSATVSMPTAPAGTYYLEITPSGYLDVSQPGGYTPNGSMGQYQVTGTYVATLGGDTTLPIVSVTSPTNGSTVFGQVNITANATDNIGVTKVEFYINNVLMNTDTSSPYSMNWDTLSVPKGFYTLSTKAYDGAGNIGISSNISVNVDNSDVTPPSVSIASPANGATLSNTTDIIANASDNIGIDHVDFYQGTTLIGADASSPYSIAWDTKTVANGTYVLSARAYDAAGNNAVSNTVSVNVNNVVVPPPDTINPITSMTLPINGANVLGSTTLTATATDNVGVTKVEFYRDTTLIDIDTTGSPDYSITWDTRAVLNGTYNLSARAYDAAGNSGVSSAISVTVNNIITNVPIISISSPVDGSIVSGSVNISASASSLYKITKMEILLDNTIVKSVTNKSSVSYRWNTKSASSGSHNIIVKAYDSVGNMGQKSITVTK